MVHLATKPRPATTSARRDARLLVIAAGEASLATLTALPDQLVSGDVLVVNDAATLPASLTGRLARTGEVLEARLLAALDEAPGGARWRVALLGTGDWRTPTERRAPPPRVRVGDALQFAAGVSARVDAVATASPRLVELSFAAADGAFLPALFQAGRPVQYAYHQRALAVWDQQTLFAAAPVALEPPSAAMHLSWRQVFALTARGVSVVALTHATGLSSTGDAAIDAALPMPERYVLPEATARAVRQARAKGKRIIATGTGVMRALESAAQSGDLQAGSAVTTLRLGPASPLRIVGGLLTGLHEEGTSHLELLQSLVPAPALERAYATALEAGLLWHEYGDACLILAL